MSPTASIDANFLYMFVTWPYVTDTVYWRQIIYRAKHYFYHFITKIEYSYGNICCFDCLLFHIHCKVVFLSNEKRTIKGGGGHPGTTSYLPFVANSITFRGKQQVLTTYHSISNWHLLKEDAGPNITGLIRIRCQIVLKRDGWWTVY